MAVAEEAEVALESLRAQLGAHPLVLTVAVLAVLALASRVIPWLRSARGVTAILAAAAAVGLIAYPAIAIWYASDPHFYDRAEPTIVSLAWAWHAGAPLYHAIDAAERYSHIYGPMAFITHAWALSAAGPSIAVSKWLGAVAGLASLGLIYASVARVCGGRRALAVTGGAALLLLTFRHYSFWVRPDSLQLFCAALALYCVTGRSGLVALAVAGAASGVLWNLRITGVLYSLPVIAIVRQRAGARAAYVVVAIAVAVAAAPFLLESVSLANYVTWIRLSSGTGLRLSLLRQNAEFAICFALPVLLAAWLSGDGRGNADRSIVRALGVGMLLIAAAASKPGAGPYHLIPFVPVIAWIVAGRAARGPIAASRPFAAEAAAALAVVLILLGAAQAAQLVSTMAPRRARADVEDIRGFLASHAGAASVEMGYGHTEAYSLLRPMLTFRSSSYFVDQPAVREYQLQGLALPAATLEAVRRCRVEYWLVPRNEQPFSGVNDYPSVLMQPLYSTEFRDAFAAAYRLAGTTRYYDVWRCAGG